MSYASLKELSDALTRSFVRYRPSVNGDVTDKGEAVTHFLVPHPTEARYTLMAEAKENKGGGITCALWFGQVEIAKSISTDRIAAAITEVLEDRIVSVVRYKNRDLYDDRHPSGWQRLFQITDDVDSGEGALETLLTKLNTPPTFIDRLPFSNRTGVFEVARWRGVTVIERT